MTFEIQKKKNYGAEFKFGKNTFAYYTNRQMKSLYPDNGFERVAEYADDSKKENVAFLRFNNKKLPLAAYRAHNRAVYREVGCVAIVDGEDRYVALLKKVAVPRIVALVLCLALLAAGVVFALNLNQDIVAISDDQIPAGRQLELEEGAVDWEGVLPSDTGGVAQGIAIPGYKSITVDANKKDVKVNFVNPEGNPCYFEISLLLEDGTELYKSKMITPGLGLYDITLSQQLKPGEYGAIVKYDTFSLDDLSPMNGAEVRISLIAQ